MLGLGVLFLGVRVMSRISFADSDYVIERNQTRRGIFLTDVNWMVSWEETQGPGKQIYSRASNCGLPNALSVMRSVFCTQQ